MLVLPGTLLAHSRTFVEKLRAYTRQTRSIGDVLRNFCAVVGDPLLGSGHGAVDAVTEIINRPDTSMETLRKRAATEILVCRFED